MPRKFLTIAEAHEYLFSEQIEADIIAIPPDVDELTDEEDVDDESTAIAEVRDIAGTAEIEISEAEDPNSDDDSEFDENYALPPPSKRKCKEKKRNWSNDDPKYSKFNEELQAEKLPEDLLHEMQQLSVLEIFEKFFSTEVYDLILNETLRYAAEVKNIPDYTLSKDDIMVFIGFLIFSGYHTLPSERDYWSECEDLGIDLVKNSMSRNSYLKLKSIIHFNDNSKANDNKSDKAFKIRPLLDILNKNFQQCGIFETHLSIDEMIVRYYGHHSLKQFMKCKPIRFGYKLWAMCGKNGYCYNFSLYGGKTSSKTKQTLPLGSQVVLDMLSIVQNPVKHVVFFDNFFNSYQLLVMLKKSGFRACGTIRDNRMAGCPLKSRKEIEKEPRGFYEHKFDKENEILMVRWNDNKSVTLASNYEQLNPVRQTLRWCKGEKERLSVPQPNIIHSYNTFMGGVDQHDWYLEKHAISIRGKKWYWCLFTRMVDMAVVNAYILYKSVHQDVRNKHISIKDFRREIAVTYLKKGVTNRSARGRPMTTPSSSAVNFDSVRYDPVGHTISKRDKQRRCQLKNCASKPRTFCEKCNVTLCIPCFPKYHTKS